MKLKKYIENLNKLVKENPEISDYEVVYSSDDEGNNYHNFFCSPSIGNFSEGYFNQKDIDKNAVCIN
jgi:hypothetical protein